MGLPKALERRVLSCCGWKHEYCIHLGSCINGEQVGMNELGTTVAKVLETPKQILQLCSHGQTVSVSRAVVLSKSS